MHQNTRQLYGRKLHGTDGDIGFVTDFYFDEVSWAVRYLVADTGPWLSGRKLLLRPHAFALGRLGTPGEDASVIAVNLTRRQIEESPAADTVANVSRQFERDYHQHFGWPEYWQDPGIWGVVGSPTVVRPGPLTPLQSQAPESQEVHLRSTKEVAGYRIETASGQIGAVDSFVIDDRTWRIRELVVETGHWYAGKKIFLLPENVRRIEGDSGTVLVNLTKRDMQDTRKNEIAQVDARSA